MVELPTKSTALSGGLFLSSQLAKSRISAANLAGSGSGACARRAGRAAVRSAATAAA
jgi:hypothetical protein